jgi:hypothetical protein
VNRVLADVGGELRLVITDLYEGVHERTEFRVTGDSGRPLRAAAHPEVVGLAVEHEWGLEAGRYYVRTGPFRTRTDIRTEPAEAGETQRTPCRRAGHPRRKCQLCTADLTSGMETTT